MGPSVERHAKELRRTLAQGEGGVTRSAPFLLPRLLPGVRIPLLASARSVARDPAKGARARARRSRRRETLDAMGGSPQRKGTELVKGRLERSHPVRVALVVQIQGADV